MNINRYAAPEDLTMEELDEVRDVLTKARGKLERGWNRFTAAKDENGRGVPADSPRACSFCLYGAVWSVVKVCPESIEVLLRRARNTLSPEDQNETLYAFNDADGRTQGEVVALFNKAIELTNEIKKEGTDAPETSD